MHTAGLPPNYLFPPTSSSTDDLSNLTSLTVLLAGPDSTPYASGLWRLHLEIPPTYPSAPPTACFQTRIWHPNVDEASGAVCVDTLKRDWSAKLTLRDVLVTIYCLLVQPNPASALNAEAGRLMVEEWGVFERRARLMTEIHARVPVGLREVVVEAKARGEEGKKEDGEAAKEEKKGAEVTKDKVPEVSKEDGARSKGKARGRERTERTPVTRSQTKGKGKATLLEEEENSASDPEADWIPQPPPQSSRATEPFSIGTANALGIRSSATAAAASMPMDLDVPKTLPFDPAASWTLATPPNPSSQLLRKPEPAKPARSTRRIQPPTPQPPAAPVYSFDFAYNTGLPGPAVDIANPLTTITWRHDPYADAALSRAELKKRRRAERRLWRRAGGCVEKWNRGAFGGLRKGLGRL